MCTVALAVWMSPHTTIAWSATGVDGDPVAELVDRQRRR